MPLGIEDSYFSMFEGLSCKRDIKIDLAICLEVDLIGHEIFLLNTGRYFFVNPRWTGLQWDVILVSPALTPVPPNPAEKLSLHHSSRLSLFLPHRLIPLSLSVCTVSSSLWNSAVSS